MSSKSHAKLNLFVPITAGILGVALILIISSEYGLAMSPDSACYISIAENILSGHGFAIYDFKPVAEWPPLYPLFLTIGGSSIMGIIAWARLLNAILFGLIILISSRWLFTRVANRWLAIVGTLSISASLPLLYVGKHVWSETLFILFVILFLMRLEKSFPKHTIKNVSILGALTALAVLTRYLGVTLIFFYFIWLLLLKMKLKEKIIRAAVFVSVSMAPLLIWMWRNYQVTGTLAGHRGESSSSFFKNIYHLTDSISIWFLPLETHPEVRVIAMGVLLILAIAWYFRKNLSRIIKEGFSQIILVNWGFILVYIAYLLIASSFVAFDAIHHRFTAPIYVPLIISVLFALAQTKKFHISLNIVGNALILVWLSYLGINTLTELNNGLKDGAGSYAHVYWQNMNFPKQLAKNPPPGKLYSNFPDALYLLSDLRASISPHKGQYSGGDEITGDAKVLLDELKQNRPIHLAWFYGPGRGFLHTPDDLRRFFILETIDSTKEGALFQISLLPSSPTGQ